MATQSNATTRPPSSAKSRRHELRHRAQSMMEEAEPFENHSEEEYETEIPEEQEDAFLEEDMAHFAEEIIEYTNMARGIVAETILGFIWITLLQQVKPVLWSSSLASKMIFIGNTFGLLSPVLIMGRHLLPYLSHPFGQAVIRLVCLGGISSFHFSGSVLSNLLLMASHSAAMLSLCSSWWSLSARKRTLSFWGIVLGMFLSLTLKVFYKSTVNPIYLDSTSNSLAALAGLLATADRFLTTYGKSHSHRSPLDKIIIDWSWLLVASGFGGLLFLSQWLFGDISELYQWVAYNKATVGTTVLWRTTVLVALATGVFISKHDFILKWYWIIVSMLAACAMCLSSQFFALIGGLILCVTIMSSWPAIIDRVTCRSPARTLILTMIVYMLLLYSVGYGDVSPPQLSSVLVIACFFIGLALQCSCSDATSSSYCNTVGKIKKKDSITEPRKMDAVIEEEEDSEIEHEIQFTGPSIVISKTAFPLLDGDQYLFFRTHVRPVLLIIVIVTILGLMFAGNATISPPP